VREDVYNRLVHSRVVNVRGLHVSVVHGAATLHGQVADRAMQVRAGQLVLGVSGVSAVHNRLRWGHLAGTTHMLATLFLLFVASGSMLTACGDDDDDDTNTTSGSATGVDGGTTSSFPVGGSPVSSGGSGDTTAGSTSDSGMIGMVDGGEARSNVDASTATGVDAGTIGDAGDITTGTSMTGM